MSRSATAKLSGIFIVGSLVLTGCSGGNSTVTGTGEPTPSSSSSSSPGLEKSPTSAPSPTAPSPSATTAAAVSSAPPRSALTDSGLARLKDSWTNQDGYKYSLAISDLEQAIVPDLANAKPGEVNVTATYRVVADVSNATPGRNAPLPVIGISPAWKKGGVVCEALKQQGVNVIAFESQAGDPGYCNLGGMKLFLSPEANIPAQGKTVFTAEIETKLSFDEAATKTARSSLTSPDFWFLTRAETDTNTTDCTIAGDHVTVATRTIPCQPAS